MNRIEFNAFEEAVQVADNGSIKSYFVKYNTVDKKNDVHFPGAYAKAISGFKPGTIPLLPNHNQNDPIGYVTELGSDDYGAYYVAEFAGTDTAQKWRQLIKEGAVTRSSFGWSALRWKKNEYGGRNIYEAKVYEMSPVSIPIGDEALIMEFNNLELNQEEDIDILDRFYGLAKNIGDKKMKIQNQAEILKLAEEYRKLTQPSDDTAPKVGEPEATEEEKAKLMLNELNEALKLKLSK